MKPLHAAVPVSGETSEGDFRGVERTFARERVWGRAEVAAVLARKLLAGCAGAVAIIARHGNRLRVHQAGVATSC
eukprot:COSAG04_NODE_516_length_13191_cov_3.382371_2_plen_75_part_00